MPIQTHNPAIKKTLKTFDEISSEELDVIIRKSQSAFKDWRQTSFEQRAVLVKSLAKILEEAKGEIAETMTIEMGKPISAALAEVDKCIWCCEYYAENSEKHLENEDINTDVSESYVTYEPMGVILAVMPWNYPIWQVMRFAIPAVMAGNTGLLKHASNVPQTALLIEKLFLKAGFSEGVFQTILISSSKVEEVINNKHVKAVTITGSEIAGSIVASQAGAEIKKSVLELGGSDPFIIFEDADIDFACDIAAKSRLLNGGQSCISAKRFIVHKSIHDEFVDKLGELMDNQIVGNPIKSETQIGPLANEQILNSLIEQIQVSKKLGAKIVIGGKELNLGGYYYAPTLLVNVTEEMPVFSEETFGPVSAVISFEDDEEAVSLANNTKYGLGASIWTSDMGRVKKIIPQIEAGAVFVNSIVRSDPRMPFGGIKKSGYGRELGSYGIKEFTNIKTVVIK